MGWAHPYFRIVRDNYAGYEVQAWRWWLPFWLQYRFVNTHSSVERAKAWIILKRRPRPQRWRLYLGQEPFA